jgi:hypothetical protein
MSVSKKSVMAGRIVTVLVVLFLLFDAIGKVLRLAPVVEGTTKLGYSESVILPLGVVLLLCTILYVIPRTCVLGAVLTTGYLGGAVSAQVRRGATLFEIMFPILFGVLVWAGIWLWDERLRAVFPVRS